MSISFEILYTHLRTLPLCHAVPPTPSRPAYWLRGAGAVGTGPRDRRIATR